jgi:nucleoside-diphosphate-sugar epimerase
VTRALVLGASGQIGRFLLPLLCEQGIEVEAVSRAPQETMRGVSWTQLDLFGHGDVAQAADWVFSAGPLDGLLTWLQRTAVRPARVIAFSSTSAATKAQSPDPAERALSQHLEGQEQRLIAWCEQHGVGWTILRPTLIYGAGLDRNLTRVAQLAQRLRVMPIPRGAKGLRQPVHAQDLAICAVAAAMRPISLSRRFDLPGGETLSWREMVQRTVACLSPEPSLLPLPDLAFSVASKVGLMRDFGPGVITRLRQDLVFDADPARIELGYDPRPFSPRAEMFKAPTGLA